MKKKATKKLTLGVIKVSALSVLPANEALLESIQGTGTMCTIASGCTSICTCM